MPGNRLDEALQQLEGDAPTPAPASPNPFDATVRELHAAGEQRLRRTFGEVADAAPDQAAQARRLGQQFGVPTAVVERNFAEYARKGQIEKPYRAIRKETPALAAWLEEPENAAVAKDDLEALGFLEWIVTAPTRAFEQGVNQIRLSQMRTREVNGATLTRAERDLLESYKYNMRAGGALGVGESWFRGAVTGGANLLAMVMGGAESAAKTAAAVGTGGAAAGALAGGLPGAVAGLGAGAAVGGVYGALQFGYDLEAGLAYDEFLDAGIEPHAARMAAMGAGAINALLETVQFKLLANTIPGVKRLRGAVTRGAIRQALKSPTVLAALTAAGREYAGTLAGESVTEAGQRAVTVLAGELAKITSEPGTDEVTRLGDADEQAFQTWAQQSGIKDLETAAYDYRGFFKANGPIPYQWGVDHLPDTFKQHGHPTFSVESTYSRGPMDGGRWAGETFITPKGRRVNMLDPVAAAAFEREQEGKPRTRRLTGPEIVAEVAQEFLGAVQAFALLPLPGAALQVQQGVQRAQQAQRNVQFFTTLGEGVAQSKTAQRMPEALESFLADATKDGPIRDVYVPLDSWVEYWQDKGVDPEQMAVEVTGSVEAFAHASATEDLVIPTARYAAKLAGTEHNAFFAQELRLKPHEMNGRESAVFLEQQARETARPPAAPEPTSPIREQLLADLTAAAVEPGTAATYADLHTSVVGNVADILGVDPVAYAARYGLTATREGLPPSAAPAARQAAARAAAQVTLSAVAAPLTDAETQALERREEAGAAPGGVERRAPTGALAADPTLLTRAAAQRRAVDTAAAAAQTRPDDTGAEAARAPAREGGRRPLSRIEESTPVARTTTYQTGPKAGQRRVVPETPVARTARRVAHYSKVFEAVAEAARALEPTVNLTALRREFDDRVELVESLDQEWRLEGHNPRVLLEAIAAAGGISVDYEERTGGQGLELRWVKDSPALGPFGSFGGVRGVFRVRAGASRGLASVGLSLDDMVRMLNQEERFAHIGDINDLVLELEWVSRLGEAPEGTSTFPGTEALRRRVGIDPRARWWLNEAFVETEFDQGLFDEAPPVKPTIKVRVGTRFEIDGKPLVVAPQGEKGSTVRGGVVWMVTPERAGQDPFAGEIWTFRVDELKRLYGSGRLIVTDALDTGEVQPRLPGAEEVREQEIATPELEAPFALTSEVSQRKGKQATLFQGAFHGSPHQFEKFSLHALGTGEGAQSFGWGLYFSSKREIAERYRQALAGPDRPKDLTFNGVGVFNGDAGLYRQEADPIIQRGLLEIVSRTYWVKPGPGWQAPMREMLERSVANVTAMHARGETLSGDQGRDRFDLENWRAAIVALDKYGDQLEVTAPSRAGRVYVVDIPEDADYLDYDRPASQQSRKVQDALTALGVRWDTFEPKSPAMFLRWFDGKDASRLWNEDVGIRESLREAHHYATQGDERALDAWQEKHQGFFPKGMVDPTGETIYGALAGQLYRSDLRPGGDIAAAYRRGPELASKALAAVGVAGIRYLDGFSRSDGQGTSNYVVFDDQLVKITEYDQAIQLAAVHQLSSENLAHADQLGGLAVPSIAVTPSTQGALQGYGEITLIGKRDLADPTKQPVFDADAYTSTFPQPEYGKAKQKVAQALVNKFRAVGVEFDDERLKDTIWDKAINTPNPRETVRAMQQSLAAQALFLREQGIAVEPVLAPATVEAAFVAMPAFQQFVQAHGGTISYGTSDTEYEQQLGAAIATAIEEYVLTAAPGNVALQDDLRGTYREAFLDEAGLPFFGRQIALSRSVAAVGRQDVQYGLTRERLEPLLRGRESAFLAWIEQQVLPMYPEPKLTLGRRKVDYTLANIVEKMLEGPTQANQSTLVFGEGKARAAAATRFTDLTWMRNAAEAIRPEGEITERRERAKALLTAWRDAVLESYTERDWRGHIDTWNGLDASMRALARWAKTRTGSAESRLASALAREGFRRVPSAVLAQGVAAGQAFLEAPVPYFESKPQRAVRLDEFAGAVIPENASDATRAILERHGIPFVTYPSDNPAARDVALTSFREDLQARGEEVLFDERRGSIRGAGIGGSALSPTVITLTARADLSTFLHETGHLYLQMMGDAADELRARDATTLTPRQQQLLADQGTVFTFLGVTTRAEIGREQHERFADTFLAYLHTGQAPSVGLRAAFARFRAWLMPFIAALKRAGIRLSPAITGVFDRLVATDRAIAEASAQGTVAPLFTDARSAGMSPRAFELYRATIADASQAAQEILQAKLLADVQRAQTAEWARRRDEIRAEVASEFYGRPVYQALAAMQKGTFPDGSPLAPDGTKTPMKLSRQAIVDEFGKARLALLPRPYVYTTEGGLTPAAAAELFGFSSGDELLTALASTAPLVPAIEAETDRRLIHEHGSMLLDGTLIERAQAAIANETRDQVVRAEMRALLELKRLVQPHVVEAVRAERRERSYERRWFEAEEKLKIAMAEGRQQVEIDALQDEVDNLKRKAAGGPGVIARAIPSPATITLAARARVAETRIRDLRPERFWAAAHKAQRLAVDAAARQDFDGAIQAQQQQLLHLALFREAERALEDVETRVRHAKQLSKPAARARIGKAGGSFLEQIDQLLERYEFVPITGVALGTRGELRRWIAAMEGEGLSVAIDDAVLDEARRVNYSELTVAELVGVSDGLHQIEHLARLTLRRLQSAAEEDYRETRDGIVTGIEAHGVKRPVKLELLPKERPARIIGEWIASHTKLAQMIASLDGYVEGGPLWDAMMRPINEAATQQATMKEAAAERLKALLTEAYTGRELARFHDQLYIPALGASISKEARLAVALNWGNEGNRQRLMEHATRRWTAPQVQAILDTLDRRDLDFVQASLDYVNSYWPAIAAKQRRVFGIAPEKVEAAPWVHALYGEQRGGYYPIGYDGRLLVRQGNIIDADAAGLQKHANYAYATTKRGYTKAREEQVNAPVRLELSVMYEHIEAVIHDLSHHEMLIDVGRLLGDRKVQQAIQSRAGDIVYRQMRSALLDIALGTRHASTIQSRAMTWLNNGTTIAGLGWNVWTASQQWLGVFNGAATIGPSWVAKGIAHVFRDASTMEWSARWVQEKSAMMRQRHSTLSREIADLRTHIKRSGSWFDNAIRAVTGDVLEQEDLTQSFLFLIEKGQQLADLPVWIGGYEKALAAPMESRNVEAHEARAIALADQAVLDSQSGGQVKDLAQVQRGDPFFKSFTLFYSYGNLLFNQTARAIGQGRRTGSVGQMLGNLLLLYAAPSAMTIAMAMAYGREDPDDPEGFLVLMGREMLAAAFNTMFGLRELSMAAQMAYGRTLQVPTRGGRGYEGPPGLRVFAGLTRLVQQAAQGEADRGLLRAGEDVAAVLFHLPLPAIQRSIDGFVAYQEGRTNNPAAVLVGPPPEVR